MDQRMERRDKWTRLSCRSFDANAVRLQLHALAYNLGNFLRTLAMPEAIAEWSLTTLREKLIKIGAKVVSHGRYVAFQMAEVAIPRKLFAAILSESLPFDRRRWRQHERPGRATIAGIKTGDVCPMTLKIAVFAAPAPDARLAPRENQLRAHPTAENGRIRPARLEKDGHMGNPSSIRFFHGRGGSVGRGGATCAARSRYYTGGTHDTF